MTVLVSIMLYGWVPFAVLLFTLMPPRRAVLVAYLLAWLFLPEAGIPIPGFPDLTKITATSMGALIGVFVFDAGRITAFRPTMVDLPMAVWCLCPFASSITNGLGAYDGASAILTEVFTWGVPYLIGRLYFCTLEGIRELAVGLFIGGLIYMPLCLWEVRMSPQLHRLVYGYHPTHFAMTVRFGGYRPMVFMQHGLMCGFWMASATLVGVWLWMSGALRKLWNIPGWVFVLGMVVTTILCKSTGAVVLMLVALAALLCVRFTRNGFAVIAVLSLAPLYMTLRAGGSWDAKELVELSASFDQERADSLEGRLVTEDMLTAKAFRQPLFGWGGWGRWRVYDENTGDDLIRSDGMWVITLGEKGLAGLCSLTALTLLPVVLLLMRLRARLWSHPAASPAAALAMLLIMYAIDNLFNAMLNPIFVVAAGGLSGLYVMFPSIQAAALANARLAAMGHAQLQQRPASTIFT